MLSLAHVDSALPAKAAIEVDEYIPLAVTFQSAASEPTVYWRSKPNAHTLLEIALSSLTGQVTSLTLTAITAKDVTIMSECLPENTAPILHGIPCMDVHPWPKTVACAERFWDVMVDVHVYVAKNACVVQLGPSCRPIQMVVCGTIQFGFDDARALRTMNIPLNDEAYGQILVAVSQS